jgi:endo-1,4-beta-mannosidase
MRHGLSTYDESRKTHFFTDPIVIDSFKQLITQYLNRINRITGIRYGDDSTVLAWQTGNEMNLTGTGRKPPPGTWTVDIAQHLKSLAPNTLVMDGSYARTETDDPKSAYAPEVLTSPHVDILSSHFYNDEEAARAPK